jgi:hypothetical protein
MFLSVFYESACILNVQHVLPNAMNLLKLKMKKKIEITSLFSTLVGPNY